MANYGIYSNSLERFIYVDSDLWVLMHSAKLLSSKMTLCVVNVVDKNIDQHNCLNYSLADPAVAKQNAQLPQLVMESNGELNRGYPLDIDLELLSEQKKFVSFLVKVVKASWLADARMNVSDHNLLLPLLESSSFRTMNDDSGVPAGFKFTVNQILYTSNTVQEIKEGIDNMFDYSTTERPTNLKQYERIFRDYIKNG